MDSAPEMIMNEWSDFAAVKCNGLGVHRGTWNRACGLPLLQTNGMCLRQADRNLVIRVLFVLLVLFVAILVLLSAIPVIFRSIDFTMLNHPKVCYSSLFVLFSAIQCYSCVRKSQMFKFGHLKLISCKSGHITIYFVRLWHHGPIGMMRHPITMRHPIMMRRHIGIGCS